MYDVVLISSVFSEIKIAEPMGACILASGLRKCGITTQVIEPSVQGWNVRQSVEQVGPLRPRIVGVSMLRDKHVAAVLKFAALLRQYYPEIFIVVGGHGPSIAVASITSEQVSAARPYLGSRTDRDQTPTLSNTFSPSGTTDESERRATHTAGIVASSLVGRGQGAGEIGCPDVEDDSAMFASADTDTPYYDKSREYLQILSTVDCFLLGEADITFPRLVQDVLADRDWRKTPGCAYFDRAENLIRNPLPQKIHDLDRLPHMSRDTLVEYQRKYGRTMPASVLASRGCYYKCTFCSVVQYEQLQDGARHRQRSNADLIAEIKDLHDRYGVTHINFEDDNYIITSRRGMAKLRDFAAALRALPFDVTFTFFCRADAVDRELFVDLRDAGLNGVYFGMESVYGADLEFFHKGATVDQTYHALDTLIDIGFSPTIDASRRIMLGYITWHPLTSFAGLRATGAFVRRYGAPPKLLRRQLRLYSATEVVDQVVELGLLAPETTGGWRFADARINNLEHVVDDFAQNANRVRDRLRTIEKTASDSEGRFSMGSALGSVRRARTAIDTLLYDHFDAVVTAASESPLGGVSSTVRGVDRDMRDRFDELCNTSSTDDLIREGYDRCQLPQSAKDIFRK